jgi:hypothetical protein
MDFAKRWCFSCVSYWRMWIIKSLLDDGFDMSKNDVHNVLGLGLKFIICCIVTWVFQDQVAWQGLYMMVNIKPL